MPYEDGKALSERFYVYVIAIDGRAAYVGKGAGRRSKAHLGKACKNPLLAKAIADARARGAKVRDRVIRKGLSEAAALKLERDLIRKHGDRLCNVSHGARSHHECLLAQLYHEMECVQSDEATRAEGPWQGLSVERRLEIGRYIRRNLAEIILTVRAKAGIA